MAAVALLTLSILAGVSAPSPSFAAPAVTHGPGAVAGLLGAAPTAAASTPLSSLALSGSSAGAVVATAYVNYNGSSRGNFPSIVYDWDAGKATVDPVTDELWLPEWPITVSGIPAPTSAPALVYDPATNQTQMVQNLTNTSALAFDPLNGYLYATDPVSNTVQVFNPSTNERVGPAIPVGINPMAIVYDSDTHYLFVANEVSNNVTVINGTTSAIVNPGVAAGTGPAALADDVVDGKLFIADSGALMASDFNTSTFVAGAPIPLLNAPTSLAYSKSQDLLAVGMPSANHIGIFDAKTGAASLPALVGKNVSSIVSDLNGTEFVSANGTTTDLTVANASTGAIVSSHLPGGSDPARLTLDPTNGQVYSWSGTARTIVTVDLASNSDARTAPDLGVEAATLAYDPASGHVFVADWRSHSLSVLNASTFGTVRQPIVLPGTPTSLADDSQTGVVYVAFIGGVAGIDARTGAITTENLSLAGNNTDLVIDPVSGLLWDLNQDAGLEALALPSLTLGPVVGIGVGTGNLRGAVLDTATNELFVVNLLNSTIAVVNGSSGREVGEAISGIPGVLSVAYDSADADVYALGTSVWVIDPETLSVVAGPIPIVPHVVAWSIVYDPSREFLYVTSNDSRGPPWPGNLTVIDGASVAASQGSYVSIPVGELPLDLQPVALPGSSAPGADEIWVTNFISGTVSIVASPPLVTFLTATPNPVDAGVSTTLLLGFEGGAGPSEVSYAGLPPSCASSNTLSLRCTPETAGSYAIAVTVMDSLGASTTADIDLSVSPAVHVQLTLGSATDGQLDLGHGLSASATVLGGTAPYNYSWTFGDSGVAWGPSVTHTYSSAGAYTVTVTVTDAGGGVATETATVEVEPLPSVSVSASPSNVTDVNVSLGFTAVVSGGTAPGNGSWVFGDGTSATGPSVDHKYAAAGVYLASYHYRDASGANASSSLTVRVDPVLSATFMVSPVSAVTTASLVQFNATISGGTEPYTVVWGYDDGSYGYGISAEHTFGTPGTYTVTLFIEDEVGAEWNGSYRLVVGSTPSSSSPSTSFDGGLLLGLVVGAAAAAVLLFVAARPKRRRGRRPPAPATAYVPPAPAAELETPEWKES